MRVITNQDGGIITKNETIWEIRGTSGKHHLDWNQESNGPDEEWNNCWRLRPGRRTRRNSELKMHVDGIRVAGSGREKRYYDTNSVG